MRTLSGFDLVSAKPDFGRSVTVHRPGPGPARRERSYAPVAVAVAGIWVGMVLATIFAPDMVSGSQQEHLPLASMTDWMWGAVATGLIVFGFARGRGAAARSVWTGVAVAAIWLAVAVASIFVPDFVTGSDPTRIPLAAMISPVAGMIATAFLAIFIAGSSGDT